MSRIEKVFANLHQQGKKGLIPYITAGDPHPDFTVAIMHQLVQCGADVVELGVPFSDPMADGPTIQAACERALRHHVSLHHVLGMVGEFRRQNQHTPVILMGYQNPIEVMGIEQFADAAAKAGVDGVLTVDLPPEEADDIVTCYGSKGLAPIFLVAPTSQTDRIEMIAKHGSGFLYYVSFKGVTGANRLDISMVEQKVSMIRRQTTLPIAVGFGIKDASTATAVAGVADAVVIGSMIVARVAECQQNLEAIKHVVEETLTPIRMALDSMSDSRAVV